MIDKRWVNFQISSCRENYKCGNGQLCASLRGINILKCKNFLKFSFRRQQKQTVSYDLPKNKHFLLTCAVSWDSGIHQQRPQRVSFIWLQTICWWGSSNAEGLGDAQYSLIAITLRSTLSRSGSVVYWPLTRPNMPFQRWRKLHIPLASDGKRLCRRAWLTIWDRVKIPQYSHKLMHR